MRDLTPKQERFCQKYIECKGNASEAYRQSYDAENMKPQTVWDEASELLKHPLVAARLKELQQMHFEAHKVTVKSLTEELEEARQLALQIQAPAPAVSATMGKAKIHGLIVDKIEGKHEVAAKGELTKDQVLELLAEKNLPTNVFEK